MSGPKEHCWSHSSRQRSFQRLNLEYLGAKKDGSKLAQTDILFGDIRVPAGVLAAADFRTEVYFASVGWSFWRDERRELGIGLGLHVADLAAKIRGAGFVNGIQVPVASKKANTTAPLPNLRLHGAYAFTPDGAGLASAFKERRQEHRRAM